MTLSSVSVVAVKLLTFLYSRKNACNTRDRSNGSSRDTSAQKSPPLTLPFRTEVISAATVLFSVGASAILIAML